VIIKLSSYSRLKPVLSEAEGPLLQDRSPDARKWNPGLLRAVKNSRITLRFIRATDWAKPMLEQARNKQIHRINLLENFCERRAAGAIENASTGKPLSISWLA
jgi:hypothetical protein